MGLRDVAALAEAIADAARLGLDIGGSDVLDRYQRWRRFDTMTWASPLDVLNKLFSNHSDVLRLARDVGLGVVERLPALKRVFIREAAGVTGDVPKLMRGEGCRILSSRLSALLRARAGTHTLCTIDGSRVWVPAFAGTTNSLSSAECCRRDRGTPCATRSRRTSGRGSASTDGSAQAERSDSTWTPTGMSP